MLVNVIPYTCLYHEGPLSSHSTDKLLHIQTLFGSHLLQHDIDGDERSSPPNSCAAVDDHGPVGGTSGMADSTDKLQHGAGVLWDAKIWPIGEVVLCYFTDNAYLRHLHGYVVNKQ